MTINLSVPTTETTLKPKIMVIGVGGAGGNAVNNMIDSKLEGVEFLVANTDSQSLVQSLADRKIQLGHNITHGLGAGSRPDIGRAAAEETLEEIAEHLAGSNMVFVTAGMGGGTGTGAAPVIARLAREQGVLAVGVVTKPFQFEGSKRARVADSGIEELQKHVDTLIVIPNQNLFRVANENTTFADAFAKADEVLYSGVRGITDLMMVPGLINLDFADIRTVMSEMGKAMMGTGEAEGEERATAAAESAISNPLLDEVSMKGARGVLINITGGPDLTLFEVDQVANRIGEEVDPEAHIIFGSTLDPVLEGRMRVSVVATGIEVDSNLQPRPVLKVVPGSEAAELSAPVFAPGFEIEAPAVESDFAAEPAQRADDALALMTAGVALEADTEAVPPARPVDAPTVEAAPEPAQESFFGGDERRAAEEEFEAAPAVESTLRTEPEAAVPKAEVAARPRPRPNLLQRMAGIGGGRRHVAEAGAMTAAGAHEPPPVAAPPPQPPPVAAPMPEPERPAVAGAPPQQAEFDGVEPEVAPSAAVNEEDLLDIPAFLRRQAN
ncbi:MAG: cell division protein FtsZ [Defluviicoccus sp.]|nr:cell division protein FtsZ [Defluviicoccus sp.]MDE0385397.1 cell division protein FtsZ [Defluviicoccus sp.]